MYHDLNELPHPLQHQIFLHHHHRHGHCRRSLRPLFLLLVDVPIALIKVMFLYICTIVVIMGIVTLNTSKTQAQIVVQNAYKIFLLRTFYILRIDHHHI